MPKQLTITNISGEPQELLRLFLIPQFLNRPHFPSSFSATLRGVPLTCAPSTMPSARPDQSTPIYEMKPSEPLRVAPGEALTLSVEDPEDYMTLPPGEVAEGISLPLSILANEADGPQEIPLIQLQWNIVDEKNHCVTGIAVSSLPSLDLPAAGGAPAALTLRPQYLPGFGGSQPGTVLTRTDLGVTWAPFLPPPELQRFVDVVNTSKSVGQFLRINERGELAWMYAQEMPGDRQIMALSGNPEQYLRSGNITSYSRMTVTVQRLRFVVSNVNPQRVSQLIFSDPYAALTPEIPFTITLVRAGQSTPVEYRRSPEGSAISSVILQFTDRFGYAPVGLELVAGDELILTFGQTIQFTTYNRSDSSGTVSASYDSGDGTWQECAVSLIMQHVGRTVYGRLAPDAMNVVHTPSALNLRELEVLDPTGAGPATMRYRRSNGDTVNLGGLPILAPDDAPPSSAFMMIDEDNETISLCWKFASGRFKKIDLT